MFSLLFKKKIVNERAARVRSQWAVFPAMLEAARDEEHRPAAMRVVSLGGAVALTR